MSKRVILTLVTIVAAGVVVAAVSGMASASPTAAKAKTISIIMKDPGCHWFLVGGKDKARLSVNGTTAFRNLDEAAVVFTGKNFNRHVAVGKTLTITKAGTYHIKMVGQKPDDNTLVLVVK